MSIKIAMYIRQSHVQLEDNFITLTANDATIPGGQELIISSSVPVPKLSMFNNDIPEGYEYAVPMSLVIDLRFGGDRPLLMIEAPEELTPNLPVREALNLLRKELKFGSRIHGTIAHIGESQGRKSIGALLRGNTRKEWLSYGGIAEGALEIIEKMYTRLGYTLS